MLASVIKCLFLKARAEILEKYVDFLVDLQAPKCPFKINWPFLCPFKNFGSSVVPVSYLYTKLPSLMTDSSVLCLFLLSYAVQSTNSLLSKSNWRKAINFSSSPGDFLINSKYTDNSAWLLFLKRNTTM